MEGIIMRKDETILNYRPHLAEKMKDVLDTNMRFYSEEPVTLFMLLLMDYGKSESVRDEAKKCFTELSTQGFISDETEEESKQVGLSVPTQSKAARTLFDWYKDQINDMCDSLYNVDDGYDSMTIIEKSKIDEFKNVLTSPLRNPNLKVSEDNKCWYELKHKNYLKETEPSRNSISERCNNIISMFSMAS
jgi:hypothetical protein